MQFQVILSVFVCALAGATETFAPFVVLDAIRVALAGSASDSVMEAFVAKDFAAIQSELTMMAETADEDEELAISTKAVLSLAALECDMKSDNFIFEETLTVAFDQLSGADRPRSPLRSPSVVLHAQSLEWLGLVHARCFAQSLPAIGLYGRALLLALRSPSRDALRGSRRSAPQLPQLGTDARPTEGRPSFRPRQRKDVTVGVAVAASLGLAVLIVAVALMARGRLAGVKAGAGVEAGAAEAAADAEAGLAAEAEAAADAEAGLAAETEAAADAAQAATDTEAAEAEADAADAAQTGEGQTEALAAVIVPTISAKMSRLSIVQTEVLVLEGVADESVKSESDVYMEAELVAAGVSEAVIRQTRFCKEVAVFRELDELNELLMQNKESADEIIEELTAHYTEEVRTLQGKMQQEDLSKN